MDEPRERMRELASDAIAAGEPTAWFERFYQEAGGDSARIPWMDLKPNRFLVDWYSRAQVARTPGSALVVGCGAGDDAVFLDSQHWNVTAFDISATAVAWARNRFPDLDIDWHVADATKLPEEWVGKFDLIVEIFTLQTLPPELRQTALGQFTTCLSPAGELFIFCRGRDENEAQSVLPWRLTWSELNVALETSLELVSQEDFLDDDMPPQRRFRALYRRPAA